MKCAMMLLAISALACGRVDHQVDGDVETRSQVTVTLDIDTSACDELYGSERQQCIKDLIETLKILAEVVDENSGEEIE